jgi:hypothetical protein
MTFEEQQKIELEMLRLYISERDGIPEGDVNLKGLGNVNKRKKTRDAVLEVYKTAPSECHRADGTLVIERLYHGVALHFQNNLDASRGVLVSEKPIRKAIKALFPLCQE